MWRLSPGETASTFFRDKPPSVYGSGTDRNADADRSRRRARVGFVANFCVGRRDPEAWALRRLQAGCRLSVFPVSDTVSVSAEGPRPNARFATRASPQMSLVRLKTAALPLRRARITSNHAIVARAVLSILNPRTGRIGGFSLAWSASITLFKYFTCRCQCRRGHFPPTFFYVSSTSRFRSASMWGGCRAVPSVALVRSRRW